MEHLVGENTLRQDYCSNGVSIIYLPLDKYR